MIPPSDQEVAAYYRVGLIETVLLLLLLLLAFGAITVLAQERWRRLSLTESLLARLAAGIVLASIAVGGLSGVILNLLQGSVFSDRTLTPVTSRNQALLGIGLALAVTVIGIIRIEQYHRGISTRTSHEEEADWKVEPPEAAGHR
ncbi:MAG: hypothetical protein E6I88_03560 [Chloroflexi bacterium]|nr:MAG: hypothetical protein E6I88_03560 [Chloroflexota bacterium]TME48803.1 MAG: hypothetical protein E6I56_00205 [Chloroflexota bacterium]